MTANLFYLILFIPLLASAGSLIFRDHLKIKTNLGLASGLTYLIFSYFLVTTPDLGHQIIAGGWIEGVGIKLRADLFSALMIFVVGAIYFAGLLYAIPGKNVEENRNFHFLYHSLFLGLTGAFLTQDLFNLFVWFEITLMSSYVLVVLKFEKERLKAGLKYIILNFLSGLIFLISVGLIYNVTKTLDFVVLKIRLAEVYTENPALVRSLALSLFGAFAIKSAFFPLFFWLPISYPRLSPGLSGVLAGLLTKLGLYAMMRVFGQVFPGDEKLFWIVLILSTLTLLVGVWGAVVQGHLRRILSYHIISQVGFIGVGVSFSLHPSEEVKQLAIASALFYIIHHIVVKTNLFFVSGLVLMKKGSEEIKNLGGLIKSAPFIALLFLVPAGSLIGIPPLSGFWAKFNLFKISITNDMVWLCLPMIIGSFFTLFSMIKIWSGTFWGLEHESNQMENTEKAIRPYIACAFLSLITLFISLNPSWVLNFAWEAGKKGLGY
jgi:multicomponent Na+:H+ antiporter subunit D